MNIVAAATVALLGALQEAQNDPAERQAQMLRQFLQLSDEQTDKVREVLKKQTDELRSVLTDDQRQRYEQIFRFMGGGRFGGGSDGRSSRGSWYPATDELKTQLSLTDDQASKINEIRDAVRSELRNFWRDRQSGGNPAEEWAAFQQKLRDDTTKKIRDALTDEQKPKFDQIVKAQAQTPTQDRGGRRGGSIEDRTNRVMENLKIEDATEAAAVKAVVRRVIELMEKLETAQRGGRSKMEEVSRNAELSDEAIGDKLEEIRQGLRELERELAAARKDLAEVVTNRQELELLRRGVLR